MKIYRCMAMTWGALSAMVLIFPSNAAAQSNSKYACSEPNPAQQCTTANTCGSASSPCSVDVKRTSDSASATPSVPNAKGNSLFCVKVGTKVTWMSSEKENGFVVDVGPSSPFDPAGAIIGGSYRAVSVVAKRPDALSIPRALAGQGRFTGCATQRMPN